ncbi:MAG: DUF2062 domain-containing protein [Chlamydiota bacterium]
MPFIKSFRKLLRILRGTDSFREMFLGVLLGFVIGMVPGFNLTVALFVIALFIFRVNLSLAVLAFAVGKFLCYSLAYISYGLGYGIIHYLGFLPVVDFLSQQPLTALLDWHVYSVLGSLIMGVVGGSLLGYGVARGILQARYGLSFGKKKFSIFAKLANNKVVSKVLNILLGKPKVAPSIKPSLFAKKRLIVGGSMIVIIFVIQAFFLDYFARQALKGGLSSFTGAEVNVDSVDVSLLRGQVHVYGLQVANADNPYYNKLQAQTLGGDLDMKALLTRRVVVEELTCDEMFMDVQREEVAEIYDPEKKEAAEKRKAAPDFFSYGTIADYYSAIKKINNSLLKIPKMLASWAQRREKEEIQPPKFKYIDYLDLSAQPYLHKYPTWVISRVKINQLHPSPGFPAFTVKGSNISSDPRIYPKPMEFSVVPNVNVLDKLKDPAGKAFKGVKEGVDKGLKETFEGLFGDE